MTIIVEELTGGVPDWTEVTRVAIRLVAAMLLGAIVGFQRERAGKPAGLRTHMLVAMGSALFVLGCSAAEMSMEGLSRVIQAESPFVFKGYFTQRPGDKGHNI